MTTPSYSFFLGQSALEQYTREELRLMLRANAVARCDQKAICALAHDMHQDWEARDEREREQARNYRGPNKNFD